jgi:hypothetical protein
VRVVFTRPVSLRTSRVVLEKLLGRWDLTAKDLAWEDGTLITEPHYWVKFRGLPGGYSRWVPESALLSSKSKAIRDIIDEFNKKFPRSATDSGQFKLLEHDNHIADYDRVYNTEMGPFPSVRKI